MDHSGNEEKNEPGCVHYNWPTYFESKTSINVNMIHNNPNYSHHHNLNGG